MSRPSAAPHDGDKRTLNPWLEAFYNEAGRPAVAVPRFFWQGKTPYPVKEFSERCKARFPPIIQIFYVGRKTCRTQNLAKGVFSCYARKPQAGNFLLEAVGRGNS